MTFNPWKPPSGWDRVEARGSVVAPLSVRGVLSSVFAAVRRRPFEAFLAVCVLPGLWEVPSTIVRDLLVPADEPSFGLGRSPRAVALSWAGAAWSSVWAAGQLSAALDVMRDQPIQWRRFLTGLKQAPLILATSLAVSLPFDALALVPANVAGNSAIALDVVGAVLMIYVFARTALWVPFIVDARRPLLESLVLSVAATRGHVSKVIALGMIVFTAMVLFAVVEGLLLDEQSHVSLAVFAAIYVLIVARLYSLLAAEWNGDANGGRPQNQEDR